MRTQEQWEKVYEPQIINTLFPPRIRKDLETYKEEPHFGEEGSFFIFGDVCTGKTILACQLLLKQKKLAYLNAQSCSGMFISFADLLFQIKSTFNQGKENESTLFSFQTILDIDILILDDFLTSRPTDWVIDTLYHLINYRYEYMKTTIITSNKSLPEIETLLGDQRITSRIDRMCSLVEKQLLVVKRL